MKACKQTNWQTIIDILLTYGLLIYLFTCFLPVFLLGIKKALIDQ